MMWASPNSSAREVDCISENQNAESCVMDCSGGSRYLDEDDGYAFSLKLRAFPQSQTSEEWNSRVAVESQKRTGPKTFHPHTITHAPSHIQHRSIVSADICSLYDSIHICLLPSSFASSRVPLSCLFTLLFPLTGPHSPPFPLGGSGTSASTYIKHASLQKEESL